MVRVYCVVCVHVWSTVGNQQAASSVSKFLHEAAVGGDGGGAQD